MSPLIILAIAVLSFGCWILVEFLDEKRNPKQEQPLPPKKKAEKKPTKSKNAKKL